MMKTIINFALFQCVWFACILGAAHGYPWLGVGVGVVAIVTHLIISKIPLPELLLIVVCGLYGYLVDSILVMLDVIRFPDFTKLLGPSPMWMVMLWACFATTINVSMGWMKGRYIVAAILGLIAGPLSYVAGVRLGALELGANKNSSLIAIGIEWGIAMPVLLLINHQINKNSNGTI